MLNEVYIIDDDDASIKIFKELFRNETNYKFVSVKTDQIDCALKSIPQLIIINEDAINRDVIELCRQIRKDEDNTITPLIVVSSNTSRMHRLKVLNESVEYFIRKPVDEGYLYYTIKNLGRLLTTNRTVSPLTGLPGNVQIHSELKKRLSRGEEFSILYIDLDNFKAYNDVYGFLKGDKIIQYTAETIINEIHRDGKDGFIGHVGGDDFIAIIPDIEVEDLCQRIIASYEENISRFFTEEDADKGYIEIANRKGIIEKFPLTSLSVAVIVADKNRFNNILEIGDEAAQVKHAVKNVMGSSYIIDRRKK